MRASPSRFAGLCGAALAYVVLVQAALIAAAALALRQAFDAESALALRIVTGGLAVMLFHVQVRVWQAFRRSAEWLDGEPVSREDDPQLWALVDRVVRATGGPHPALLLLTDDVNASIGRVPGAKPGPGGEIPHALLLGGPLVDLLSHAEMEAVVAHELAHAAFDHVDFTARGFTALEFADRADVALRRASILSRWLLAPPFALLCGRIHREYAAVRRAHELDADRASLRVQPREVVAGALMKLHAFEAHCARRLAAFEPRGRKADLRRRPSFEQLLAEFRSLSGAEFAAAAREAETRDLDHDGEDHPSLAQRIAVLGTDLPRAAAAAHRSLRRTPAGA